ncbi:hypothetical protein AJ80_05804 [Polytolypa hystricis UAMH7299]|uniref:Uncharacterized protein n=1 Tax=Polytolypa hystricis (strain UAMH7299) TaxID=1447883 RepID=A0A2B7Y0F1_POLH7|nr:hypothetical protein AJ80_05804 [Polytolypa hystricis UAMH7299]
MSSAPAAKIAHVNLMTDTIVANLSPDALRTVLRSMLAADDDHRHLTTTFQDHVQKYLQNDLKRATVPHLFSFSAGSTSPTPTPELTKLRKQILSLTGSGLAFESLRLLEEVVRQSHCLPFVDDDLLDILAGIDGELVQALTAAQKIISIKGGTQRISLDEGAVLHGVERRLHSYWESCNSQGVEFPFERGLIMLTGIRTLWK